MKPVVTFGEIMLRLAPPGMERFLQSPQFVATFGGGEANVAVAVAQLGLPAAYVTVLPDAHPIAEAAIGELRRFGVDTSRIVRGKGRMGIYYLEAGANQRASKVVYDRANSAIALVPDFHVDNSGAVGTDPRCVEIAPVPPVHGRERLAGVRASGDKK